MRFNPVMLMLLGLVVAALAQDDPEGTLCVRAVYTGSYSARSTDEVYGRTGAVVTERVMTDETWDKVTLLLTSTTTWRYKDGVPVEMKDDCRVSCSGQGGLRNLTRYVTAVNKNGEWAPHRYSVMEDGAWTYSVPPEPSNQAQPPLMGSVGSVVVVPFLGTYTVILFPWPNIEKLVAAGSWTHRMRPKSVSGGRVQEDEEHPIDASHKPPGGAFARHIVKDAARQMQEALKPGSGIQGTWDVKKGGFTASGHLSEPGGPGIQTTRTSPFNDGVNKGSGLTIVTDQRWTADLSWSFAYNQSTVEAVIKPSGDYKKWVPSAGAKQGKAGNTIAFKVELRDKKTGGKPKNVTATFQFKLLETSKEPGSCMNSPWKDTEPDLKILKQDNSGLAEVDEDGQGARSKDKLTECPVTIACFDGGAHARLQVVADLSEGPPVMARLEGGELRDVALPCDSDGNHIADAWENDKKVAGRPPGEDQDDHPPGDRRNGDGLTVWEEYRGFLEEGKHIRTDPHKKDFFLCDTIGGRTRQGIERFAALSKLDVHARLTLDELDSSRVVNRNHGPDSPHVVDQHGIRMDVWSKRNVCGTVGGPGTPGSIVAMVIDDKWADVKMVSEGGRSTMYASYIPNIAHELLHCCNVWHHGDKDCSVWWNTETVGGKKVVYEYMQTNFFGHLDKGDAVRVIDEEGAPVLVPKPMKIYLGEKQGQHSGDVECVMRYSAAVAYVGSQSPDIRVYFKNGDREVIGQKICSSPDGTGVNAPDRKPEPRYGNADAGRGACVDKICVSDYYLELKYDQDRDAKK